MLGTSLGGITDVYGYNEFGEVMEYAAQYNGSDLYTVTQELDKLGRIISKTEMVAGETHVYEYSYDSDGRLTDVYKDGTLVSHYTYDDNGNRLSHTTPEGTTTGTYDDQDRLLIYGGETYEYTANGELLRKTDANGTTHYVYDVLGNLLSVTLPDGMKIEYIIDGQSRRIGKKVNGVIVQGFLYQNELEPVAELDGAGNIVARFVYGTQGHVPDYMIKDGVMYRIISDYLGSVRLVVDVDTGQVVQRMEYDEFGNVLVDTNPGFQPFGYAGGIYDRQTKLIRFGSRDYDAVTGRWFCKDPHKFEGDGTNLYIYCINDPINLIDQDGLKLHLLKRLKNGLIGAGSGAVAGAVTGAGVGAIVGAVGGAGVGAGPGALAGATAGAIGGGVAGFFTGLFKDPCAKFKDVAISGAISGGISGALAGGGAVAAGWSAKVGMHGAHHTFGEFGKLPHVQMNIWQKGVSGSGKAFRIPWPWGR